MKKLLFLAFILITLGLFLRSMLTPEQKILSGAPPYDASSSDFVNENEEEALVKNWMRPEGPAEGLADGILAFLTQERLL